MNWNQFSGKTLNVTLVENYGLKIDQSTNQPFYEITFKVGKLVEAFDEGLLLENKVEDNDVKIFIPFTSIKCVEIV
ncbi:MAG: hypothetical protein Q8903_02040 [Bacteroidota bacterium]|nr:hypothetical protein [Bacteroidota bacterium]